jgi:hypothetical protein
MGIVSKPFNHKRQTWTLRSELAAALSIKVALLFGLWILIFHGADRPLGKPNIAAIFDGHSVTTADQSTSH